jgi:3-hydroxy-9,10-secoandrosta-1,3,5(10)-triene-9,17-dione monooxygenase reductase component
MTTSIDKVQFRNALGAFTTGVTIVTTRGKDGNDYGLTANSFNSVSLDPPMVLWSLSKTSGNLKGFASAGHFAVHILAADQEATSNRFAKGGADKFAGMAVERGHGEVPLLDGCSARFECRMKHLYEGGDHVIVVGEVISFDHFNRPPLAFHGGNYGLLLKKPGKSAGVDSNPGNDWLSFMLARAYYQLQLPVRESLQSKGLRDIDYSILSLLSMGDGRTIAELAGILAFASKELTVDDAQRLAARGLVTLDPAKGADIVVRFTDAGRECAIELLARAKAAESAAERDLDYREAQVLKLLLKRVIDTSAADLPDSWRKESMWREDSILREQAAGSGSALPKP